ncbi:hypothetical protein [Caballeronia concitans]|uniref:hypothetical protein n=1 Tax=Caballeronia concitans TaxID=1777133 RepID=UPI000A530CD5|nr:hypothetical protein [Caballeronia concitans]
MDYLERAYHEPWDFNPAVHSEPPSSFDSTPTHDTSTPAATHSSTGAAGGFINNNPELVAVVIAAAVPLVVQASIWGFRRASEWLRQSDA